VTARKEESGVRKSVSEWNPAEQIATGEASSRC